MTLRRRTRDPRIATRTARNSGQSRHHSIDESRVRGTGSSRSHPVERIPTALGGAMLGGAAGAALGGPVGVVVGFAVGGFAGEALDRYTGK